MFQKIYYAAVLNSEWVYVLVNLYNLKIMSQICV